MADSRPGGHGGTTTSTTSKLISYLKTQPTECVQFGARLVTIICTIYYILPFGTYSAYTRAFAAAAATFALRLHQRVGRIQFTRECLLHIFLEDSCHYIIYSVIFMTTKPVAMALQPIFLYALLNVSNFTVKTSNAIGMGQSRFALKLQEFNTKHTPNLLAAVAFAEIFIMPLFLALVFTGQVSIFFIFIYYQFIVMRYMSRRNIYMRAAFNTLRASLENAVAHPNCPQVFRWMANSIIRSFCYLCPTTTT